MKTKFLGEDALAIPYSKRMALIRLFLLQKVSIDKKKMKAKLYQIHSKLYNPKTKKFPWIMPLNPLATSPHGYNLSLILYKNEFFNYIIRSKFYQNILQNAPNCTT